MSYSLSGNVITQTGTDEDLSGLASVSGVQVYNLNNVTFYDIGARKLVWDGDQTINANSERIVSQYVPTEISSDSAYRLGTTTSVSCSVTVNNFLEKNGDTLYFLDEVFNSAHVSNNCCAQFIIYINSFSGTLTMNGGRIYGNSSIELNRGTVSLNNTVIETTADGNYRHFTRSYQFESVTIINLKSQFDNNPLAGSFLRGTKFFNSFFTTQGTAGESRQFVLENAEFQGRPATEGEVGTGDANFIKLLNPVRGSLFRVRAGQTTAIRSDGLIRSYKEVQFNFSDVDGNPLENIEVNAKDYDNGARRNWTASNKGQDTVDINFTDDKFYNLTSDSNGSTSTAEILLSVVARPQGDANEAVDVGLNAFDLRTKSGTRGFDTFDFYFISYVDLPSSTELNLTGPNKLSVDWIMFTDLLITESNKSTVEAYTEITNSFEFYDYAKSHLVDNFQSFLAIDETNLLVNRESTTIDLHGRNLIIDANALSAFSVDNVTGDITIKASVYTGNLRTTGTVTLLNDAFVNGFIADSEGDSGISVTVPFGYDESIGLYPTKLDAEEQTNIIAMGPIFTYFASVYGGQTLWYRLEQDDGSFIIENYLVPSEAAFYTVNLVVTGENAALASIKAVTDRLLTMIEVDGTEQVFTRSSFKKLNPDLNIINENIKKSSLLIPAKDNLNG